MNDRYSWEFGDCLRTNILKIYPPPLHFSQFALRLKGSGIFFPQTEARAGEVNTANISCCSELAQIHVSAQLSDCLQRARKLALLGLADILLQWNFLCCRTYGQRHAVHRFCFYSVSFPWTGLDRATVRNGAWRRCQHISCKADILKGLQCGKRMPTAACERVQCHWLCWLHGEICFLGPGRGVNLDNN